MTDRTVPADPREALARALSLASSGDWECDPEDADAVLVALGVFGYTLAARQDEPSPALRALAEAVAVDCSWGYAGVACDDHKALQAWLAANPPQTREAEGAALDPERLAEALWETSVRHDEAPWIDAPADDRTGTIGWAMVILDYLRVARTPEAQRDAEPPDPLDEKLQALGLNGPFDDADDIGASIDAIRRAGQRDAGNRGIDAAWAEVEAALPRGWVIFGLGSPYLDETGWVKQDGWRASAGLWEHRPYIAGRQGETDVAVDEETGEGPTPIAALRDLARKLAATQPPVAGTEAGIKWNPEETQSPRNLEAEARASLFPDDAP